MPIEIPECTDGLKRDICKAVAILVERPDADIDGLESLMDEHHLSVDHVVYILAQAADNKGVLFLCDVHMANISFALFPALVNEHASLVCDLLEKVSQSSLDRTLADHQLTTYRQQMMLFAARESRGTLLEKLFQSLASHVRDSYARMQCRLMGRFGAEQSAGPILSVMYSEFLEQVIKKIEDPVQQATFREKAKLYCPLQAAVAKEYSVQGPQQDVYAVDADDEANPGFLSAFCCAKGRF